MQTFLAIDLSTNEWLTTIGVAVNIGLLVGLIWELRASARARREDTQAAIRLATVQDWRTLSDSIREVERATYVYFGRQLITSQRAAEFEALVRQVSDDRRPADSPPSDEERSVIEASEAMRSLLNAANSFAIGVEAGAYDRTLAQQLGGWRLANVLRRYWGHISLMRQGLDSDAVWGPLEQFVRSFIDAQQVAHFRKWAFLRDGGDDPDPGPDTSPVASD